jgi:hypothetical protein
VLEDGERARAADQPRGEQGCDLANPHAPRSSSGPFAALLTLRCALRVLVDAENVRRSRWPNVARRELEKRVREWAEREGHEATVVFEGAESADDWIACQKGPYWLVTSDRELCDRCGERALRVIGGGAFLEELGLRLRRPG